MPQKVGFACHWGPDRTTTWSGTPWALSRALLRQTAVADLDVTVPPLPRFLLRAAGARRQDGRWRSSWRHSATGIRLVEQRLTSAVADSDADTILEIGDLGVVDRPFYVLQDLSYDLLTEHFGPRGVPHFRNLTARDILRLRERQHEVYSRASGIIAMSAWLAASVARAGVPEDRIRVVHPGANTTTLDGPLPLRRRGAQRRLLFIGRDFDTKAGDQVVAAYEVLRARHGDRIRLTVAGPPSWPLGRLSDGVTFLGPTDRDRVAALYDEHDLFVMPSRFEGFGIAFVEALARGLPCIGRRACAMPEIIDECSGGRLISSEDPVELADTIDEVLADDGLYNRCADAAMQRRQHFSWDRAAMEVLEAMS